MKNQKLAIEGLLPDKFIYQIGAYLQTCAHIELMSCALIVCLEGKYPEDEAWFDYYVSLRKQCKIKDLINRLAKVSHLAEEYDFSKNLHDLSKWIKEYVNNRHMASHGAFFGSPNGYLRVDYCQNKGRRDSLNFVQNRTAITDDLIGEALQDANNIYLILSGMLEKIRPGLTIEAHRLIVPIVEHPSD